LVLLGDSGVGKSCIVLRFVRGQFDPTSKVIYFLKLADPWMKIYTLEDALFLLAQFLFSHLIFSNDYR
jgi:GTPase SAR1 family protein